MYTQCTECRTVYQIGPEDLKRAHGQVRCGACGTVFDALQTLSHEPPPPQPPTLEPEAVEEPAPESAIEPAPAGPPAEEAEWSPEPAEEPEPSRQAEAEPEPESEPEPLRFDDDTPLEEILASFGGDLSAEAGEEEGEQRTEPAPPEPHTDGPPGDGPPGEPAEAAPDKGDAGETDDLGDEDEWRALLAELELDETTLGVGLEGETDAGAGEAPEPPETEPPLEELSLDEEPSAPEELGAPDEPVEPDEPVVPEQPVVPEEPVLPEKSAAPEQPAAAGERTQAPDETSGRPAAAEERDELAASAALFDEIVQSGEFAAILGPDNDVAAAAAGEPGRQEHEEPKPVAEAPLGIENETAGGTAGEWPAEDGEQEIIDQTLLPRRRGRSRTALWSAAALLLVAALGAQVIHGQRAQLATHPEFGPRLQQIYGLFGADLQPRWDIGALCVESSSGDARADSLQITSVIVHQGDRPQPYPLLQVSLTDRWQSVIGSRSVEADDYLPAGELRDVRMHPGDRVRARARLSDPGSEAAGYELHVCYRGAEGDLRCSGACR